MLKCGECGEIKSQMRCSACKRQQAEQRWQWELDNGNRRLRCPDCGGAMSMPAYADENPYNFCPYCGKRMIIGEQLSMLENGDGAGNR